MTGESVRKKVTRRLIPFLFVLYITAYLDRVNVGFAALQMNADLKFSHAVFGIGSGIFFLGYCLFEVPSNLILARVGARLWIARIMITWGAIASAMMLVKTPLTFYALRFLLGVAEAGFFPGVIYYLSQWFPPDARARAIALFMTGIPFSGIVGGPISGALLNLDGVGGLAGWQWLFLIEGLPPIFLGVIVLWYLPNGPCDAAWLSSGERNVLIRTLGERTGELGHSASVGQILGDVRHWLLGIVAFLFLTGFYGYLIWSPQLIKAFTNAGYFAVGVISGLMSVLMAIVMVANSAHSDKTGERLRHLVIPLVFTAIGFVGTVAAPAPAIAVACLAAILMGIGAAFAPFWCVVSESARGPAAAASIGLVATIGNSGGFFGPTLIGLLKESTGTYQLAFLILGGMAILAAVLAARLVRPAAARLTALGSKS